MSNYIKVYSASGVLEAKSIQGLLKSFNIESEIFQESVGITYGLTIGSLGEADILVSEDKLEEAKQILTLMENGKLEIPDDPEVTNQDEGL